MNTPSRMMPPTAVPKKATVWTWIFLLGLCAAFGYLLYSNAGARLAGAAIVVFATGGSIIAHGHFKRLREERKEESICTFAKALPARAHDTWIARAVYEELSRFVQIPIRPTDDLYKDLRIDPDDLDEVAYEIARRSGRSMAETKKNPMFDHVVTVSDMIAFFEKQRNLANKLPLPTPVSGTPAAGVPVAPPPRAAGR